MAFAEPLPEELTNAVYHAALEPQAWDDVMQSMKRSFPSVAQTFYLLHMQPRRIQPVSLVGIEPAWIRNFDSLYFAADNPWIRMTQQLHRPGIVRTNERLDRVLRTRGALYRSSYYNEWMRPQGFKYTIGNTLLSDGGIVANITLMRAPDMKTFNSSEVRRFEALSRHMTRALQMSLRLESIESGVTSTGVLDALPQALAIVDAQRRVLHANAPMQALLRRKQGLTLREGRLEAAHAGTQPALAERIAAAFGVGPPAAEAAPPLPLPGAEAARLRLSVMPLVGRLGRTLIAGPTALLMVAEGGGRSALTPAAVCLQHGYTPAEGRLAALLARGHELKEAAQRMGVTYGTARSYLKAVFDKTGVHSQAQLVARLLGAAD
jgi:DNA-binding CsgD family transcriptional regulator/PAS domain-containing protein